MNTIVFNNEATFGVESFNKNTSFEGSSMTSTGYASLNTSELDDLTEVAQGTITSIKILHDEEVIYNSTNLSAKITSINEYLSGDRMNVNININFA